MNWNDGCKEGRFYSTCFIAEDNGNLASKLSSAIKIEYRYVVQCESNNQLSIHGKIPGNYNFWILSNSKDKLVEAKMFAEKLFQKSINY